MKKKETPGDLAVMPSIVVEVHEGKGAEGEGSRGAARPTPPVTPRDGRVKLPFLQLVVLVELSFRLIR